MIAAIDLKSAYPLDNLCRTAEKFPFLNKHFDNSPILIGMLKNLEAVDQLAMNDEEPSDSDKVDVSIIQRNLNCLHQLCDEWLNTGHFSTIPAQYRVLYAYCCAIHAKFYFISRKYFKSLRCCDEGLLKGNDLEDNCLSKFANFLCQKYLPLPLAVPKTSKSYIEVPGPLPNSVQIPAIELPSLEEFYTKFYLPGMPVVITGMVPGWPAYEKWSFSHLNAICGHRLMPVELGSKYTDENWCQLLMTFNQYLLKYVFPFEKPAQPGYLAQHRLLDQVPELLDDVPIPDYCTFGEHADPVGDGEAVEADHDLTINAFIGPSGTVSPLHTDPRNNFFCQVRGRKFVRLISPKDDHGLYLYDDLMRQNTSQVNAELPDFEQFPNFALVQCHDFVVEAGQCLFIPRGWFHHVRALEPSISISIWFGPSERR